MADQLGEDLEICSKEARKGRCHQGLIARWCNLLEWVKLAIAVNLAWGEGTGCDEELTGEADTIVWGGAACSGDAAGGSYHLRNHT
jgi:hypothetical protein